MKRVFAMAFGVFLLAVPVRAQEQPAEAPKPAQTPTAQTERREPNVAARPAREEAGQPVNIRIDVTITDQQATGQPVAKTMTMVVADNWQSRIRTEGSVWSSNRASGIGLNVDARPRIVGDKILLQMTLEYKPTSLEQREGATATSLNQSFQVLLSDGKPLVVSQSADPNSDRKVKLEVKATVLR